MEFNDKKLDLIFRAVTYILADLRIEQMSQIKLLQTSSSRECDMDEEAAAALAKDIADYTTLHQDLETCIRYSAYPLSD